MYWWLLGEFICIYCGSVDNMQFLKSLTRGGVPNAHPSPGNPRFQAASTFCVVVRFKMQLAIEQALRLVASSIGNLRHVDAIASNPHNQSIRSIPMTRALLKIRLKYKKAPLI